MKELNCQKKQNGERGETETYLHLEKRSDRETLRLSQW
jgi:hypothetical protein